MLRLSGATSVVESELHSGHAWRAGGAVPDLREERGYVTYILSEPPHHLSTILPTLDTSTRHSSLPPGLLSGVLRVDQHLRGLQRGFSS
jgi:hypothetical protein